MYNIAAAGGMALYYRHVRERQGSTLTLAFNAAAYSYLLGMGSQDMLFLALETHYYHKSREPAEWAFGPIHIVPAAIMIGYRQTILRQLGRPVVLLGHLHALE